MKTLAGKCLAVLSLLLVGGFFYGLGQYAKSQNDFVFWTLVEAVPLLTLATGLLTLPAATGLKIHRIGAALFLALLEGAIAYRAPNLTEFFELQMLGAIPAAGALALPFAFYGRISQAAWEKHHGRLAALGWLAILAIAGGYGIFFMHIPMGGG